MKNRLKCLMLSLLLLCGCNPGTSSLSSDASESVSYTSVSTPQEHEMVEIKQYPESYYLDNYGPLEYRISVTLGLDENVWFKYTSDFEHAHCFVILSTSPYNFAAYWDQKGNSIAEFDVNDENHNKVELASETQYHGYYEILLKKDQSIYFNVNNIAEKWNDLFFIEVDALKDNGHPHISYSDGIERHIHTYGFSFESYDSKQHKSFCWKDEEYVLEDHRYGADGTCLDCGYIKEV